jgi:hypothetical protein
VFEYHLTLQFDPGRAQNRAPVDLGDDGPAPAVEPYYTPGIASTAQSADQSPQMSQYPRSAATTDGGYYNNPADVSRGPSSASTAGFAGRGGGMGDVQPMATMPEASNYLPGGSSGAGYNPGQLAPAIGGAAGGAALGAGAAGALAGMSAKQREAYQERQRNQVGAGVPEQSGSGGGYGSGPSSPVTEGGRQTVISEDAGPMEQGGEVPPT